MKPTKLQNIWCWEELQSQHDDVDMEKHQKYCVHRKIKEQLDYRIIAGAVVYCVIGYTDLLLAQIAEIAII
jgi:hypothetical protein